MHMHKQIYSRNSLLTTFFGIRNDPAQIRSYKRFFCIVAQHSFFFHISRGLCAIVTNFELCNIQWYSSLISNFVTHTGISHVFRYEREETAKKDETTGETIRRLIDAQLALEESLDVSSAEEFEIKEEPSQCPVIEEFEAEGENVLFKLLWEKLRPLGSSL